MSLKAAQAIRNRITRLSDVVRDQAARIRTLEIANFEAFTEIALVRKDIESLHQALSVIP